MNRYRELILKRDINKINVDIMRDILNFDGIISIEEYSARQGDFERAMDSYYEAKCELKRYGPSMFERLGAWIWGVNITKKAKAQ